MAADWTRRTGPVGVLTGAGISTDSGIPDFRGPQGVWTKDPIAELLFTYDSYLSDPDIRRRSWQARAANPAWHAQPNAAHRALVELADTGRRVDIITQNIDRLHQKAGSAPETVVEIHGNMFETVCIRCDYRGTMRAALDRAETGEPDPDCPNCHAILKSATVMFGQAMDRDTVNRAMEVALASDIFLAIGSSLQVQPAASMCEIAVAAGAALVIVNAEPTPYDDIATEVIHEPIGTAIPRLVQDLLAV